MLKLTTSTEPRWLDLLPGVRVQVRPFTVTDHLRARGAATDVFRANPRAEGEPVDPTVAASSTVAMVSSYARAGIIAWEGVGDADGEAAAVTPEAVDAFMTVLPAFDAFDRAVVVPALAGTD